MGLYRMEKENGGEMYLEISDPPGLTDEQKESIGEDVVYVCTRTPYRTSMYGQVESCGFVDRAKLKPLDGSKKKDAKIIQEIQDVRNEVMMKHYWHREGNSIVVQNAVCGRLGQRHTHSLEGFERWVAENEIPPEALIHDKKCDRV